MTWGIFLFRWTVLLSLYLCSFVFNWPWAALSSVTREYKSRREKERKKWQWQWDGEREAWQRSAWERENDVKTGMVPGLNKALSQLRHYKMEMHTSAWFLSMFTIPVSSHHRRTAAVQIRDIWTDRENAETETSGLDFRLLGVLRLRYSSFHPVILSRYFKIPWSKETGLI